ncbi:hypothetical protein DFH08DRAFT_1084956 [Mycena albidolilacea]|uniref:WD40 repeat-like protein n=1 Tax=Mycena albidolilacea TaxID=1033008 RepID=A0AAD6ZL40_9AGAR|nr:hypothetical protein DFH08DRAFT_1084956 [Mycena albidolilacea]
MTGDDLGFDLRTFTSPNHPNPNQSPSAPTTNAKAMLGQKERSSAAGSSPSISVESPGSAGPDPGLSPAPSGVPFPFGTVFVFVFALSPGSQCITDCITTVGAQEMSRLSRFSRPRPRAGGSRRGTAGWAHLHADTVTRPASPNLYGFEVVHREDGADDDQWPFKRASPFRSLLPRIWDISASPPQILTLLPPELSLHILNLLLFPSGSSSGATPTAAAAAAADHAQASTAALLALLSCRAVSRTWARTWARLASYNVKLPPLPPDAASSLPLTPSPAPAPSWCALYRARLTLERLGVPGSDHAQASSAALLALLCCRAVSRAWARLASDNAVWRAFIARWGVPPSPPTRPSRPSPPPRTSSLAAARMKKLPPLPPDAASPLPLIPSPAFTPSWRALYRARLALERRWGSPAVTNEIAWQPPARALSGHADSVYCLEFSRSRIFTGSRDRAVKVWSVRTGRLLGTFAGGHRGSVLCLKFELSSSAGNLQGGGKGMRGTLVTGSSDCTVCVWDLWTESAEEDAEVRAVLGAAGACSICASIGGHEGPVNAVGLEIGEYDEADAGDQNEGDTGYGEGNRSQRHEGRVVSASGDGKMILWDIKSGERVRTFEGHDRGLACIEFKGDLIISGSNDCKIKIWSASTGACLRTLVGTKRSGRLVSASYDRSVRVWDLGALCGAGSGGAASASAGGGGGAMRVVRDSHTSHIFDVKFDGRRIHVARPEDCVPLGVLEGWAEGGGATEWSGGEGETDIPARRTLAVIAHAQEGGRSSSTHTDPDTPTPTQEIPSTDA